MFIRDLKRKIKTILQINERGTSNERASSQKSNSLTPTIIVDDTNNSRRASCDTNKSDSLLDQVFSDKKNFKYVGRYRSCDVSRSRDQDSSSEIIEQAVNKYLHLVTQTNSFDLKKIIQVIIRINNFILYIIIFLWQRNWNLS